MRFIRNSILAALYLFLPLVHSAAQDGGQQTPGSIHGTVTDPSGAVIASAQVAVSGGGTSLSRSTTTRADGQFVIDRLVPGRYTLTITASGFAPAAFENVLVNSGQMSLENVALHLPVEQQQVRVDDQTLRVDTSADSNASAIVIKGKDLDALSDDPDELQNELSALAGPSAGPNGGQIYIDGFTGGQLPPKSSIREIRINSNPFSAQYDKLGYGRIEIFTKPGTDKFRGMAMVMGNDSAFNSLNPFVTQEPSYYTTFLVGNTSGPLNRNASWFASVFDRNNQSNSIVNAELINSGGTTYNYTAAVANPQSRLDISPRFDFQLGANNTLSVRYMFDRQKETNDGVSQFALQSQAYKVLNHENTVQISDTQILSAGIVNETRFQYMGDRNSQVAQSTDPTITVQGSFTGGGNNQGTVRDSQDHYELQNYTMAAAGAHGLNFGLRLRLTNDSSYSTSGFNGNYIYPTLQAYLAGSPEEYDVVRGNPKASASLFDAGLFFQDDYKVRPNLTFSYGLRFESQNRIGDHADWAPRLSFAWAPGGGKGAKSTTIIRGGYGWFYDRFSSTYVLDAIRDNGINQQEYIIRYQSSSQSTESPTITSLAPHLRAALNMQAAASIEHQFGKLATVSATYVNSHGVHQYLSDNINAYLPGTYDAATGTGVRPNGIDENIDQFQSGGIYNQNQLVMNYTVRARRVSLFGFYMLNFAKADTSGATYFPSNQFDPGADYGRATFDQHNRFLLGGSIHAPYGVSLSPMLVANSGQPFNIALSNDLNDDNQYNDRPAFATASSTDTVQTAYGKFELDPAWNAARLPYNYGNGPSEFSMNLRVSKSIGIGPRITRGSGGFQPGPGGPGGGPPPGGGPGGGGPGGGLGPGGLGSDGGPPKLDQELPRRYSLTFAAMGRNIFNNVNLAQPVGVVGCSAGSPSCSSSQVNPLFGKSTALAGGFFSSAAANRSIDLQMSFSF
jgi:hypothetical protein